MGTSRDSKKFRSFTRMAFLQRILSLSWRCKSLVREYVEIVDELNMFKQCDYEGVGVIYHYYSYPPQS